MRTAVSLGRTLGFAANTVAGAVVDIADVGGEAGSQIRVPRTLHDGPSMGPGLTHRPGGYFINVEFFSKPK